MLVWPAKDPDETLSYGIDWTSALNGDPIVSATLVITSGGATISAFAFDETTCSVTVSGGLNCVPAFFTNTVTTAAGFIYEQLIELPILATGFPVGVSTTTKQTLVKMAFEEIGLAGYEFDATPEEQSSALRRLDALMRVLQGPGNNIRLNYNFPGIFGAGDLSDPSGIPDAAIDATIQQLALRIMPAIGKSMSPETRVAWALNMNALRTAFVLVPQRQIPRTTAIGSGNKPFSTWSPYGFRCLSGPVGWSGAQQ